MQGHRRTSIRANAITNLLTSLLTTLSVDDAHSRAHGYKKLGCSRLYRELRYEECGTTPECRLLRQVVVSIVKFSHEVVTQMAYVVRTHTLLLPKYLSVGLDGTYPKL